MRDIKFFIELNPDIRFHMNGRLFKNTGIGIPSLTADSIAAYSGTSPDDSLSFPLDCIYLSPGVHPYLLACEMKAV